MIDTHAHIDDPQYADDLDAFLAQQKAEGVEAILVPGVDVTTIEPVLSVCRRYPDYLFPGIGLHPENVQADWREQLAVMQDSLKTNNYI
ncbi:MAG: TatD family hydrolase, partial [Paludibacteraceae bacterium]|nr:TatD family hydrolase [Paludibacteraceae bacterium]